MNASSGSGLWPTRMSCFLVTVVIVLRFFDKLTGSVIMPHAFGADNGLRADTVLSINRWLQRRFTMGTADKRSADQDTVVLVHGLAALPFVMRSLAKSLRDYFGQVVNWGYPSLWSRIERHGKELAELLRRFDSDERGGRIHLIGHSMGGIIGRLALAAYLPLRMGRFIMLAPPNRGSHVARRLAPI